MSTVPTPEPGGTLDPVQIRALLAPLYEGRVRQHKGNDHLEAWDVRRHLIRVFGFGGWSFDALETVCVDTRSIYNNDREPMKGRHTVVYRVVGRLTIRDRHGRYVTHFEDGAAGDSSNQPNLGDAHDQALKTAMSQALKRCAVNLGDRYGLSLYDKNRTADVGVVGASLAHADPAAEGPAELPDAADDVDSGEVDETRDATLPARAPETPEDFVAAMAATTSYARVVGWRADAAVLDLLSAEVTIPGREGPRRVPLGEAFDIRSASLAPVRA